jgi:autotransporter-associated beta strand protein
MRTLHLVVASMLSMLALRSRAETVTWKDVGSDWLTGENWDPPVVPGAADVAVLPAKSPIACQPLLDGAASVRGLEIKNAYNQAWTIGGTGTLTLGTAGVALKGSRLVQQIEANVALAGDQCWFFQSSEQRTGYGFRLKGRLGGRGDLALEERRGDILCNWYFGDDQIARSPSDFELDGSVAVLGAFCEAQFNVGSQPADGDFVFGGTPSAPAVLRIDRGARFRFRAGAEEAGRTVRLLNPVEVGAEGGNLAVNLFGTAPPQVVLRGGVELGGPLGLWRSKDAPAPEYAGTWRLPQDRGARCGILHMTPGYDLPAYSVAAALVDGAGMFANPLLVQSFHQNLTLTAPADANTYAHGTVVDLCGTSYKSETMAAQVVVDAASRLGVGGVVVLPGGKLRLPAASCLGDGQPVDLRSGTAALAVLESGYDGLPALAATARGVVALGGGFSGDLDLSALGDGFCYLGTVSGGTFAGDSLAPAADGVWRLGAGGGSMNELIVSQPVLNGTNRLKVGQASWQGNGNLRLSAANTFAGEIEVGGITHFNRDPQPYGVTHIGSRLGVSSLTSGSAWGDPAGTVRLRNSQLAFVQVAGAAASVRKETLRFEGRSRLHLNFPNHVGTMTFGNLARENRGTLTLYDERSGLAVRERIVLDTPPTEENGVVPAWLVHERGPHFVTHGATAGFADFTGYATDLETAGANDVVNTAAATLTADRACHGLRNTGAISGDYTLSVGAGGILMGEAISSAIDFGDSEGLIYSFTDKQLSGTIAGSNGLTVSGNRFDSRAAHTFAGPLTVNSCAYWARFDEDGAAYSFGDAGNAILLNGGALVRQAGDRILASRTIALGEGGGMIAGTSTVHARITGEGLLTIGNMSSGAGSVTVTIANPGNDYAGGTFLLSTGGDRTDGRLTVTPEGSLGTGDLVVNAGLLATLQGDANLAPGATAQVAMNGRIGFESAAPLIGGLAGGGAVELGTMSSSTTLTVGGEDTSSVFHGRIAERSAAWPGALAKAGNGRFTLYGAHGYTGATTVQAGEFALHGSLAGDLAVNAGGTLLAVIDKGARVRRGHVAGDVTLAGTLAVGGEGGGDVPIGTALTVLTCGGTIRDNLSVRPAGYSVRTAGGALTLIRVPVGTVFLAR